MDTSFSRASRVMLATAAFVIVVAGMKQAAPLLVPFLLSIFIAVLSFPVMQSLQSKGLSQGIALILVVLLVLFAGLALALLVGSSMDEFSKNLPMYQHKINLHWSSGLDWLARQGLSVPTDYINSHLDPKAAMKMVASILTGFGNVLANSFLIFLTVIFILLEAGSFQKKISSIGEKFESTGFSKVFAEKLRTYMSIKTWMSLITGVLVTLWLWILGVDYPQLWGVLAFVLNYVPNIGSIIAAVPAVFLALIQAGTATALLVVAGYAVINVVMGNVVEPKYMGKGLGLSALVVFVSLVFWGWVLGPVGMLLSVPLTVTVKLALDSREESHWLGVLLGPAE